MPSASFYEVADPVKSLLLSFLRLALVWTVVSDADTPTPPCGGCRQVLREFGNGIAVIAESADGSQRTFWSIDELLPHAFGPDDLQP